MKKSSELLMGASVCMLGKFTCLVFKVMNLNESVQFSDEIQDDECLTFSDLRVKSSSFYADGLPRSKLVHSG